MLKEIVQDHPVVTKLAAWAGRVWSWTRDFWGRWRPSSKAKQELAKGHAAYRAGCLLEAERFYRSALQYLGRHDPHRRELLSREAEILLLHGDFDGALALCNEVLRLANDAGDPGDAADSARIRCDILAQQERYDEANRAIKQAEDLDDATDPRRSAHIRRSKALLCKAEGNPGPAGIWLGEARTLYAEAGDCRGQATVFRDQGNLLVESGKYVDGRGDLERALKFAQDSGNVVVIADVERSLGEVDWRLGDPEQALRHGQAAAEMYLRAGLPIRPAHALTLQARSLGQLHRWTEADGVLGDALGIFAQFKQKRAEGQALLLRIEVRLHAGPLCEIEPLVKRAEEVLSAVRDQRGIASLRVLQAETARRLGDTDAAAEWLAAADPVFRRAGDRRGMASVARCQGDALADRGRWAEAEPHHAFAHGQYSDLGAVRESAEVAIRWARCLGQIGRLPEALAKFDTANQVAHETSDQWLLAGVLQERGRLLIREDKPDAAVQPLREAIIRLQKLGDLYTQSEAHCALAEALAKAGKTSEAITQLRAALGLLTRMAAFRRAEWVQARLDRMGDAPASDASR